MSRLWSVLVNYHTILVVGCNLYKVLQSFECFFIILPYPQIIGQLLDTRNAAWFLFGTILYIQVSFVRTGLLPVEVFMYIVAKVPYEMLNATEMASRTKLWYKVG